jgi:hypothetical protein
MNHLCAFYENIDSATLTEINTVVDDVLTRSGTKRFLVPQQFNNILWAAALGTNVTRAQIATPSVGVRRMSLEVVPRVRGAAAFDRNRFQIFIPPSPIPLIASEEISFMGAEDAAGANNIYGLVALGPASRPAIPSGDIRLVRATGSTTLTPNQWTTVTVTPELSLEPGKYQLIGFLPISAGCIAARALITGQNFRPGVPGIAASEAVAVDFDMERLERLEFEPMGEFTHINPPQFQFLSASADTTQTVFMWVIRTGAV